MILKWKLNDITGETELARVNHIKAELKPGEKIEEAAGYLEIEPAEGMFFNGYQTWTITREYRKNDKMRGLNTIPKVLIKYRHYDGYSDYHFMDYPYKKGRFHGYSYCYFRNGGRYTLFASLDEKPGYTVFEYNAKNNCLKIMRDAKGLIPGGEYGLFDLFCMEGTEEEVFNGWFEELGITPLPAPKIAGYSSWYNRYKDIDEDTIMEDLDGCSRILRVGDLFQVDDGWEKNVGDWTEADPEKFPHGMKEMASKIHDKGYRAGLWMAPFAAAFESELFRNHPEWMIRDENGKLFIGGGNWGGFAGLDIDIPECREYIEKSLRRAVEDWGFDLLKLDFLYMASTSGSDRETRAARMTRAMEIVRSCAGDKVVLACGVPLMPCFGLVEYCRIGCDVGPSWNGSFYRKYFHRERVSTKNALIDTIA